MKNEIVIGNNNWLKALDMARELVEEGYAVMITTEKVEEDLDFIILDYIEAYDDDYRADRNQVIFKQKEPVNKV